MTLLLKQIFSLIKIINSETGTNQIATAIACGFILGMTPSFSLQTIVVVIIVCLFRIQLAAVFVSAFFFKIIAWGLDPVFHLTGDFILNLKSLKPLYETMYNMPLLPFTRFNNTIVAGSGITSIVLSPFIFIVSKILINKYREVIVRRIKNTKLWKALQATSLFKWYYKYDKLYN